MDSRVVEDLILDLLAQDAGVSPVDLRRQLEDLGELMPIDSLLAVEVLARVEAHYGVVLPATAEAAEKLGSVVAFAQAIVDLVEASEAGKSATA